MFEYEKKTKKNSDKTVKTEEDCNATVVANKYKELMEEVMGVNWDLTSEEIVNKMIEYHKNKLQEFGDSTLVLCSFDGAVHNSDKKQILYHSLLKFICIQW